MRLYRTTKDGESKHCEDRRRLKQDGNIVCVEFGHFGKDRDDPERWHHFKVCVDWKDIEALIVKFQEMGNLKARRIKKALRVASALEQFAGKKLNN